MKNVIKFMAFAAVVLFMASCSSYTKTGVVSPLVGTTVNAESLKADIDFNQQKITGESKLTYLFGFIKLSGGNKLYEDGTTKSVKLPFVGSKMSRAKKAAMYDALDGTDYDLVANPQYKNEVHSYLFGLIKNYKSTVNGYGGKIKKIYQE